jgi:hypothetical protein
MLIIRFMLYANTCRLISVLTLSSVLVKKWVDPIQAFSVSNGCFTTWPVDVLIQCAVPGGLVDLDAEDAALVEETYDRIALSISDYENSSEVNAFTSKYDAYLAGLVKLTREEKQGLKLSNGRENVRVATPARLNKINSHFSLITALTTWVCQEMSITPCMTPEGLTGWTKVWADS